MKAIPTVFLSVLLLSACAQDDGPPAMTAQEQDEAQAMLTAYETARSGRNWENAETVADKLRRRFPESDAAKRLAGSLDDTRAQAEAALFQRKASVEQFPLSKLNLNNGIADTGWPVGMAIKAAHKDLAAALDTAMKSLRESGELLAMFKQHGLTLTAP